MSIVFYGCMSMDGYLADRNHQLEWLYQSGTPAETDYDAFYARMDVTLMGKRTYDTIKDVPGISKMYQSTRNYVFTHQTSPLLAGFTAVHGDICELAVSFKPSNIWVIGGNTILKPLLEADLMDELIIQVAPVLLGKGIPLFTQDEGERRFKLMQVKQYAQFAEMTFHRYQ